MILEGIDDLQFQSISREDVDSTCDLEFTEDPNFTIDFLESTNAALSDVIDEIKHFRERSSEQNCWNVLREKGIDEKTVQVWLFYIFIKGSKNSSSFEQKHRAVLAARFHFILLREPGSSGCQFFHSIIYEKSINILKIAAEHNIENKKQPHGKDSQSDDEENDDDVTELSTNQVVLLLGELTEAIRDFCYLLEIFSLKGQPDSIQESIRGFVQITKCFREINSAFTLNRNIASYATAEQLAYKAIRLFVSKKHGSIRTLSLLVFRLLAATVTMKHAVGATTPRSFYRRSEVAMKVVEGVWEENGAEVEEECRKLLQNLVVQCPDRMEFKQHIGIVVSNFLHKLPAHFHANYVGWLHILSTQPKVSYRVGALAVMGQLLNEKERDLNENSDLSNNQKKWLTHKFLLQDVNECMTDIAPKVRSKALSVLSEYLGQRMSDLSTELPQTLRINFGNTELERPLGGTTNTNDDVFPSLNNLDSNYSNELFTRLRERCKEDKFNVRKTGLQAMESAVLGGFVRPNSPCLEVFVERCRDPSLSIRKQSVQSMTNLLTRFCDRIEIRSAWVECLFPSIKDPETSMQEKAASLIEGKVLQGIVGKSNEENLAWQLLSIFTTENGQHMRLFLSDVTKQWHSERKIKSNLLKRVIQNLDNDDRRGPAWMFLSLLTFYINDAEMAGRILTTFQPQYNAENLIKTKIDMICCIGNVFSHLEQDKKDIVISNLQGEIEGNSCDVQLIGIIFEALEKISKEKGMNSKEARNSLLAWYVNLLTEIDRSLYETIMSPIAECNYPLLVNQLYVVGELAQRCPKKVPKRLLLLLQSLLTDPKNFGAEEEDHMNLPLSQFHSRETPAFLKAHAIFNLGRVCFHNEGLAKKCVPAMARELEVSDCEKVRENVLIVLTDLCVIQTQLVDLHLNDMATCLADKSISVRQQCIVLFCSLLSRGFIKWKGTILLKFLHAACDPDHETQTLARSALIDQLMKSQGVAGGHFFRSFIACLFYYNLYEGKDTMERSEREKKLFDISGKSGFPRRMEIYKFMLNNMEDEHRINLTQKLCFDVLEAMVEGQIPLNSKTEEVVSDCLAVLCCKEIRLKCLKTKDSGTELEEEMLSTQAEKQKAVSNKIRHKIISGVVKQNLMENVIPIIIAVKNMLVARRSHLVGNVMLFLKEVMKEYKKEVKVILSEDKQLADEIEFDLRRFERQQEEELHAQGNAETPILVIPEPQNSANKSIQTPAIKTPFNKRRTIAEDGILSRDKENRELVLTPATILRKKRMSMSSLPMSSLRRAISTPSAENPNITFAATDVSMIPKPNGL